MARDMGGGVKIFLFDLDGTLIWSGGAGLKALQLASREEFGLQDATSGIVLDGMTDLAIVRAILEPHGLATPENIRRLIQAYLRNLRRTVSEAEGYRVLKGVCEALDFLEGQGRLLALATGNVKRGARIKLERGALWHRFRLGGFGSDSEERVRIVKLALLRARRALGDRAARAIVIGDTPRDISAARGAGLPSLAVATGRYDEATLRQAGADVVLPNLARPSSWLANIDRIS